MPAYVNSIIETRDWKFDAAGSLDNFLLNVFVTFMVMVMKA